MQNFIEQGAKLYENMRNWGREVRKVWKNGSSFRGGMYPNTTPTPT